MLLPTMSSLCLLAALLRKLKPSSPVALPPPTALQRRIEFVRGVEEEREQLEEEYLEERRALELKYAALYGEGVSYMFGGTVEARAGVRKGSGAGAA